MSQDPSPEAPDQARPEPKTFAQEQVNSLLADQKRKVAASYQDYDGVCCTDR